MVENSFKTVESEEVYLWECETLTDIEKRISYFIEEARNLNASFRTRVT
jgi:hypothetical protein